MIPIIFLASVCVHHLSSASHQSGVCLFCVCVCVSVCMFLLICDYVLVCMSVTVPVFCCMFGICACACICVHVCVCVGQGCRHAAVCRPAVPFNGGTADDTTTADGGGPEVAGTGGKAAGNTHIGNCTHTQLIQIQD